MQIQNMFSRLLLPLLLAIELPTARAQSLVQNGGLEDLSSTYVNESAGYMSLGAGSTAISGWKVADGVAGSIAWGNTDFTGGFAHDGKFFVDLTGLGNASPNGAIDQTLSITPGITYTVGLYLGNDNDAAVGVSVGGNPLSLSAPLGTGVGWTYYEGTFVGSISDLTPTLEVANISGSGFEVFVDGISVSPVPEPSTAALLAVAGSGLIAFRRKRGKV